MRSKMKTYKYRVANIIANDHIKPNGGIGAGLQSCVQMFQDLGAVNDIIMDKAPDDKPRQNFVKWFKDNDCNIITPLDPLDLKTYKQIHGFSNSICLEESLNFRNSIYRALHKNIYDLIVVHSTQAGIALYGLDILDRIPSVMYTHDYNAVFKNADGGEGRINFGVGITRFNDMVYRLPGYIVGTHSQRNVEELAHPTAMCLPLPLTAKDLLKPLTDEEKQKQNGVLFIGRWEPRKDPEAYCDLIAKTKLPAKLLVSSNESIKKFKAAFEKRGITDYEFAIDRYEQAQQRGFTTQDEKCAFIRSCKVSFLPYVYEAYGLAQYETLCVMPGVVYEHNIWHENFRQFPHLHKETKQSAPDKVLELHNNPQHNSAQKEIIEYEATVPGMWNALLSAPKAEVKSTSRFSQHNNIWHNEVVSKLKRHLGIEDIQSVLNAQHLYQRYYTLTDTWYTKDNTPPIENAEVSIMDWAKGL